MTYNPDAPVFKPNPEAVKAQEDFLASFPDDFDDLQPVPAPAQQPDVNSAIQMLSQADPAQLQMFMQQIQS